jgi:CRISPR-associated protein Cmr6
MARHLGPIGGLGSAESGELPLIAAGVSIPPSANAGLVYERYLKIWQAHRPGYEYKLEDKEKREGLLEFVRDYNSRQHQTPIATQLEALHDRLRQSAGREGEGYLACSRMVLGMGASHPMENGFLFDRNLGVPYIPGSSMKGLARVAANELAGLSADHMDNIFGHDPDALLQGQEPRCGDIVFLAAYPERVPKLAVDVINPHHAEYYDALRKMESDTRRQLPEPMEVESPIPVFYLVVDDESNQGLKQGCPWRFYLSSRSNNQHNLKLAIDCLTLGLMHLGIGGKTSAGMGYMKPTSEKVPDLAQRSTMKSVRFASVFLSHNSKQKDFVREFRKSLGRRGIVGWLDEVNLKSGDALDNELVSAIDQQDAFVLFLSKEARQSRWVNDEIAAALLRVEAKEMQLFVVADTKVSIDKLFSDEEDPESPLTKLAQHMSHPDGKRINRIVELVDLDEPIHRDVVRQRLEAICDRIAQSISGKESGGSSDELAIWFDHRGSGPIEEPPGDAKIEGTGTPSGYVFRPGIHEDRDADRRVPVDQWDGYVGTMTRSLGHVLGSHGNRLPTIHIGGRDQLAVFFQLGIFFAPRDGTNLVAHQSKGASQAFDNLNWPSIHLRPISDDVAVPVRDDSSTPSVESPGRAIIIATKDRVDGAISHAEKKGRCVVWFKYDWLNNSDDVRKIVDGVVKFLRSHKDQKTSYIYASLPAPAVALLGSRVRKYDCARIVFCEYNAPETQNRNGEPYYDEYEVAKI